MALPTPEPQSELDGLPVFITVPHAAQLLGLKRASAYRLAASGELPAQRLGGRVYIVTARLAALLRGVPSTLQSAEGEVADLG